MKKLLTFVMVCVALIPTFTNAATLDDPNGVRAVSMDVEPGGTCDLVINFKVADYFTAYQFNLYLPDGIEVVTDADDKCIVELNDEVHSNSHKGTVINTGTYYSVYGYSSSNANLTATSGELLRVPIRATADYVTAEGSIEEIKFVPGSGTSTILPNSSFILYRPRVQQSLNQTEIPSITYGETYTLPASTNEGQALTWTITDNTIASVSGNTLTTLNAGTTTLTATQAGNDSYKAFSREFTLTVSKAELTITADNKTKHEGDENPALTVTYTGFVNNDDASTLTTQPTITTTATTDSPEGTYPITVNGATSDNYDISYVNGTLTVGVTVIASGECGTSVTYSLTDDGVLTISGSGEMANYAYSYNPEPNLAPWVSSYANTITSVVIEEGVTTIGKYAFSECPNLLSASIPASVTSIGQMAFGLCPKLAIITVADGNTVYNTRGGCNVIIESASNTLIQGSNGATIPNGVEIIRDEAFNGCSSLTSINIPASVTSIGFAAFYWCQNLATITFADGSQLTSIGFEAFNGCSGLNKVIVKDIASWASMNIGSAEGNPLFLTHHIYSDEDTEITELVIPNGVTSIGDNVFNGCSYLTSVTIPNSVTGIGTGAFAGCSGLSSVTLPNSVTSIGTSAFEGCSRLTSINIPTGITGIGVAAFRGCSSLTSINIPADITYIADFAFQGCDQLATVTLNNNPQINLEVFPDCATVTMNLTANEADGAKWMTFYNKSYSFQADVNTQVFQAELSGTGELTLREINDKIVNKDVAVILKSSSNPVMTLTTTDSSDEYLYNDLRGVYPYPPDAWPVGDGTIYVLNCGSAGIGFYKLANGKKVTGNKAYLVYDGGITAPEFMSFSFGNTTGISEVQNSGFKVQGSETFYNLSGQRVAQPTKGLYIVNGKKVVIK